MKARQLAEKIAHPYVTGLKTAKKGWKNEPKEMLSKLAFSAVAGQGLFWRLGYDQLGLFMNPKAQMGLGQQIAEKVYEHLPKTDSVAWTIKAVEIATDAGKMPLEGALYAKYGYAPDVVAALVTQPLWSALETGEKITGSLLHPERVTTPDGVKLSLSCIYGSLFRYGLSAILLMYGPSLYSAFKTLSPFPTHKTR